MNPRISVKGVLCLFQALRANLHMKITHFILDKCNLEMGNLQEQVTNYLSLIRVIAEYIRVSKGLQHISLNQCSLGNETMNAIGKGLL